MANTYKASLDITEYEWDQITTALSQSRYASIVMFLRKHRNKPKPAHRVLPSDIVNQGNEQVNAVLLKRGVPFRLTRTSWYHKAEERKNRLLAFVRWPP